MPESASDEGQPTMQLARRFLSTPGERSKRTLDIGMSVLRVLLVDDFGPWRRFLCSALEGFPLVQIVGEASDGFGAIQAAKGLKPDLVLLDIGLPQLNGLEVAREILKLSPACKIIFATQESSAEIMQEALKLGAQGYILKGDAGIELLPALEAVLRKKLFVSSSLRDESHQRDGNRRLAARPRPPVCRIY